MAENEEDLLYGDLGAISSSSQVAKEEIKLLPSVPVMPVLHVYPLSAYSFGVKEAATGASEWETSFSVRMANLERFYERNGMRRSVEAILLTYEHNHPHVLLLQLRDSNVYKL